MSVKGHSDTLHRSHTFVDRGINHDHSATSGGNTITSIPIEISPEHREVWEILQVDFHIHFKWDDPFDGTVGGSPEPLGERASIVAYLTERDDIPYSDSELDSTGAVDTVQEGALLTIMGECHLPWSDSTNGIADEGQPFEQRAEIDFRPEGYELSFHSEWNVVVTTTSNWNSSNINGDDQPQIEGGVDIEYVHKGTV